MPLLDHFRPPLLDHRAWEGLIGAWNGKIADVLNRDTPGDTYAEQAQRIQAWYETRCFRPGRKLFASVRFACPCDKQDADARRAFAGWVAERLRQGIGVLVIDVATPIPVHIHTTVADELGLPVAPAGDLCAVSYRPLGADRADAWFEPLAVGSVLPAMPLWIAPDEAVSIDLETIYSDACRSRRTGREWLAEIWDEIVRPGDPGERGASAPC